jgi:hypothetical protein
MYVCMRECVVCMYACTHVRLRRSEDSECGFCDIYAQSSAMQVNAVVVGVTVRELQYVIAVESDGDSLVRRI